MITSIFIASHRGIWSKTLMLEISAADERMDLERNDTYEKDAPWVDIEGWFICDLFDEWIRRSQSNALGATWHVGKNTWNVLLCATFFFIPYENNRQVLVDREGCRGRPDVDYAHITERSSASSMQYESVRWWFSKMLQLFDAFLTLKNNTRFF
jgi:hypothetical protein